MELIYGPRRSGRSTYLSTHMGDAGTYLIPCHLIPSVNHTIEKLSGRRLRYALDDLDSLTPFAQHRLLIALRQAGEVVAVVKTFPTPRTWHSFGPIRLNATRTADAILGS